MVRSRSPVDDHDPAPSCLRQRPVFLYAADLTDADLSGAEILDADLNEARLVGADDEAMVGDVVDRIHRRQRYPS